MSNDETEIMARMNVFATRLAILRKEHDMSMKEFAKAIKISQAAVSRYESGERAPELHILIKIAKAFKVSLEWLTGGDIVYNSGTFEEMYSCLSEKNKTALMQYTTFLYESQKGDLKNE